MNTKKFLLTTLVVMMLFAVAPLASATEDIDVLFIGWEEFSGANPGRYAANNSCGPFFYFNIGYDDYNIRYAFIGLQNDEQSSFLENVVSGVAARYDDWADDTNYAGPTPENDAEKAKLMMESSDIVTFEMIFSPQMFAYNPELEYILFEEFDGSEAVFISTLSDDWLTGNSYAPDYFVVRDNAAESPNYADATEFLNEYIAWNGWSISDHARIWGTAIDLWI